MNKDDIVLDVKDNLATIDFSNGLEMIVMF